MSREREGLQERIKEQINNGTHGHDEIHWIMARELEESGIFRIVANVAEDKWGGTGSSQIAFNLFYRYVDESFHLVYHINPEQEKDISYPRHVLLCIRQTKDAFSPRVDITYIRANGKENGELRIAGSNETYSNGLPQSDTEKFKIKLALEEAFTRPKIPQTGMFVHSPRIVRA